MSTWVPFQGRWISPEEKQSILRRWWEHQDWREESVYKLSCVVCGRDFFATRHGGLYCSRRCANSAFYHRHRPDREKQCPGCGTRYVATRVDAIYCSPKCRQAAYRRRRAVTGAQVSGHLTLTQA